MTNTSPPLIRRDYRPTLGVASVLVLVLLGIALFGIRFPLPTAAPHAQPVTGQPTLLWMYIVADLLTGTAYILISGMLAYLVFKGRHVIPFQRVFIAFGLLIVACGLNHLMHVWTLWLPNDWAAGGVRVFMAVVSVMTAFLLPPLLGKILRLIEAGKLTFEREAKLEALSTQLSNELAERRRVEDELRRSEQLYRTLIRNFPKGAVVLFDHDLRYMIADGMGLEPIGLSREGLEGKTIWEALPTGTVDQIEEQYRSTLAGNAQSVEVTHAGHTFITHSIPVSDTADTIFAGMVVTQDITDRVEAEAATRASEERFRLAFTSAPIGMALVALDGSFKQVNQALCESVGYENDELVGVPFQDITHPDDLDADLRYVQQLLNDQIRHYQMEKRYIHKLGHIIWIRLSCTLVRDQHSAPMHFIAQIEDITAHKKVEEDLKQAKVDSDAANRAKSEFLATISHELRTPLTSIRGSLGLVTGGVTGPVSPAAKTMLDIAYKNSERLVRLINDILDIEKIESGKMTFDVHVLKLMPVVEQALAANCGYAEQFGVNYALTVAERGIEVNGNADHLMQILTNLLSNAAKFSPVGGTVDVSIRRQGSMVRVAVTDQGSGIPDEFRSRIFQKFAQADSSDTRQKGGTGLGLSIARAIVEKHGGQIGFTSEVGSGTTFYFDLLVMQTALNARACADAFAT